jgi:AcrR family transcriptional regulator
MTKGDLMTDLGDRRVRRTRRLLSEALVALILERGYDRITVGDVLTRADVGRSTFYSHFRDKDDLLMACFDELRQSLHTDVEAFAAGRAPADTAGPVLVLFEHAYQHRTVYQALCGRHSGETVLSHLHGIYAELLRTHLPARVRGPMPIDVVVEFLAGSAIALFRWWLDADMPHPPRTMAGFYQRLTESASNVALRGHARIPAA